MRQLKSSAENLKELFASAITVKHIAEPLASFDETSPANAVHQFVDWADFDLIGVRSDGQVCGYARREDLDGGCLGDHLHPIEDDQTLVETASIPQVMRILKDFPACFVTLLGQVGGIVTRGDQQKAPVRMWLFGLITLLEMQMLRVVKLRYPRDNWQALLNQERLSEARCMFQKLRAGNQELGLADCLQFCDKRDIILTTDDLWPRFEFASKGSGERLLRKLEKLRNELAHAQDILEGRWPELLDLAEYAERTLQAAERITETQSQEPMP